MLIAVLFAVTSYAGETAFQALNVKASQAVGTALNVSGSIDAPRAINAQAAQVGAKAESDYVVITAQPEGELKTYTRGGYQYYVSSNQLYYRAQSGTIDIVWGSDNKVYLKDIVSGLAYGSWVEGTVSGDGTTITVALDQNLRYVSQYDACVAIKLLKYTSGEGFAPVADAESVTFTVADGVISMQGTALSDVSLAGVWTDDGTIQNYGDVQSVYTPYEPNLNLVTLPEGLTPVEKPLTATFFADVYSDGTPVEGVVNVAKDGNDVYIQGLVKEFPDAWVKGTLAEGTVTVPVTYVGTLDGTNIWLCGYSSSGPVDIKLIYNADLDAYEVDGYVMLNPSELSLSVSALKGYYQAVYIGEKPAVVVPPEGLEIEALPLTGQSYDGESTTDVSKTVNVGVDGSDVYVQGFFEEAPEGWIKGSFSEDGASVVFPMGQYVGACEYGSIYLVGRVVDEDGNGAAGDVTFSYDAAKNLFTLENRAYASGKSDQIYYYSYFLEGLIIGEACDEIWVAGKQGYENAQEVTEFQIAEGIKGVTSQGEGSNAPKYYDSGETLRLYAGNTLTISSEKEIAKIEITMNGSDAQKRLTTDIPTYTYAKSVGTWEGQSNQVVFTVPSTSGSQARIQKIKIYYFDYKTTIVEVPQGLETVTYQFKGFDTYFERTDNFKVEVGFDGDFVYIQGLSQGYVPDAWVRGEIVKDNNGNGIKAKDGEEKVVYNFPNWGLGEYASWLSSYDLYFSGATMTYDPVAKQFTCDEYQTLSDGSDYAFDEYSDITITLAQSNNGTPADPKVVAYTPTGNYPSVQFEIPTEDVDGNIIPVSDMTYVIYVQKEGGQPTMLELTTDLYTEITENLTEIPYEFSDDYDIYVGGSRVYLNQSADEIASWVNIGVQSINRGLGEEHRSNIVWYFEEGPNGVVDINLADGIATYFDLQGRVANENTKGILIKQVRDSKGNILKVSKVVNK